jgi:hypothetical protein
MKTKPIMKTDYKEIKALDFTPMPGEIYTHPRRLHFVAKQKPDDFGTHITVHDDAELKYDKDKTISDLKIDIPIMFIENTGYCLEDIVGRNSYLSFALDDVYHHYAIWKVLIGESCSFVLCSRFDHCQFRKII